MKSQILCVTHCYDHDGEIYFGGERRWWTRRPTSRRRMAIIIYVLVELRNNLRVTNTICQRNIAVRVVFGTVIIKIDGLH